eukprot:gnl/Trimastix_PCT/4463.p1 GENE.gnl/Trimastix_PCT/4463~~gnl/Trimastix_PCT/4463.p1  ORF type:complete len:304 (+),score=73.69 gnl/Trimastix_PCT/4463:51-962(+)
MKAIDAIQSKLQDNTLFCTFEFFPPRTEKGTQNVIERLSRMRDLQPAFVAVPWGPGGTTADATQGLCRSFAQLEGINVMMHLTCTNMEQSKLVDACEFCKENGIHSILALRGDPPQGSDRFVPTDERFAHAIDLVRFIRREYGDTFSIGVAGYPKGHEEATSFEDDLRFLKEKVDAGADFIVSQFFFDPDEYINYIEKCREIGIMCPILPGVVPFVSYSGLQHMCQLSHVEIPAALEAQIEEVKDDNQAVAALGVRFAFDLCNALIRAGIRGFHFYTMNQEDNVRSLMSQLQFCSDSIGLRAD